MIAAFLRRPPEQVAAAVNALVVMLIPSGLLLAYLMTPTPGNTVVARVSPLWVLVLDWMFQISLLFTPFVGLGFVAGWRTLVHASRYRQRQGTGWRGVAEAAGLGFLVALLVLSHGILTRPLEAPPYIVAYGGGAAILGLVLGLILRGTALLALTLAGERR